MASLIPGYEYDIFISYRQKDNKGDRWVSEFVEALKTELESTFKEEISVYFDINPHDGLLDTYDVDASLKEKLKCVVFIPIISRTYCDPKSFAWEHEFKAFVDIASQDKFGLKVKLSTGNVASRVLPIRIHTLDVVDIKLCESIIGGMLRGVDFIYKSIGVNRPLRVNEDHPQDNLNKTYYRDQINKVANAVKEIIYCLEPDPKKQMVQEVHSKIETEEYNETIPDTSGGHFGEEKFQESVVVNFNFRKLWALLSISIIFLLGVLGLWGWLRPFSGRVNTSSTYSMIPTKSILMDGGGQYPYFCISPDGRTIAIISNKGIQLKSLSAFSEKTLDGTERANSVIFSPDGKFLAFTQNSQIYKIGISGTPKSLVYSKSSGGTMSWGIDGYIYFSAGLGSEGIWRVSANGGEAEQITSVIDSLGENAHTWPQLLPDSKTLLFTVLGPSGGSLDSRIVIQQINSKKRKTLIEKAFFGRSLANGRLLFANNDGNIFSIHFNLNELKLKGEPLAVLSDVNTATWSGAAFISVSENGNVIFLPRNNSPLNVINVTDHSGKLIDRDSIPMTTFERMGHGWHMGDVSASGTYMICSGRTYGSLDIWELNLYTRMPERITFDPSQDEFPVWSQDEKAIAYVSSRSGTSWQLLIKDLDSSGNPHLIRTWPRHIHPTSWSPDRKWLAAYDYTPTNGMDCYVISIDSMKFIPLAGSPANEANAQFSPDGHWLVFQSGESGRSEIYVLSFPKLDNKRQVSIDGGEVPRWDRSGKVIYYMSNGFLIELPVETGINFKKGTPVKLFQTDASNFALSPDGQKFYLYTNNLKRTNPPLYLITNWFEELENKTGK